MNNIKSLLNQIEVEDILKMIETEYFGSTPTIKIPWHSLEQGQMIPYLRSLERRKIVAKGGLKSNRAYRINISITNGRLLLL